MTFRTDKVASLLHREAAAFLNQLELPHFTTVHKVEASPDLKHAKVWITILPDSPATNSQILELISQQLYVWQGELNRKLKMRNVPRMAFAVDHSTEYASHINQLLKQTGSNPEEQHE